MRKLFVCSKDLPVDGEAQGKLCFVMLNFNEVKACEDLYGDALTSKIEEDFGDKLTDISCLTGYETRLIYISTATAKSLAEKIICAIAMSLKDIMKKQ